MAAGGGGGGDGGGGRREQLDVAPPPVRWGAGRAVLVGDAAHALPINLAQGAACAMEGAYTLGEQLGEAFGPDASPLSPVPSAAAEAAFARYQQSHGPRVRQCAMVTAFTQALAAPASPPTEALRNAMRFVPPPINGWIFDVALEVSLGDRPARTRALWPLATS